MFGLSHIQVVLSVCEYLMFVYIDVELAMPEKGNIFYAVNTAVPEIQFVVRKKSKPDLAGSKEDRSSNS